MRYCFKGATTMTNKVYCVCLFLILVLLAFKPLILRLVRVLKVRVERHAPSVTLHEKETTQIAASFYNGEMIYKNKKKLIDKTLLIVALL